MLLPALVLTLAAAGCGGDDSGSADPGTSTPSKTATTRAAPTPAAQDEPAAAQDQLTGDWQIEFTCQQSNRAIHARLSDRVLRRLDWEDPPCDDQAFVLLARFDQGALAVCDPDSGQCEVNATYEMVDEDTIRVDDPTGNLCNPNGPTLSCPVTWDFDRTGDSLTFRVNPDPWVMGLWEAAPFELVS